MNVNRLTYEGAFAEMPPPGYHVISQLVFADGNHGTIDVIKIPLLEPRHRMLDCHYEILVDELDDERAILLIVEVILCELTDHYYQDQVDSISFVNVSTLVRRTVPYPS